MLCNKTSHGKAIGLCMLALVDFSPLSFFSLQLSYVCLKRYYVSKENTKTIRRLNHSWNSYRSHFYRRWFFGCSHSFSPSSSILYIFLHSHRQFTFSFNVAFYLMAFKLIRFCLCILLLFRCRSLSTHFSANSQRIVCVVCSQALSFS